VLAVSALRLVIAALLIIGSGSALAGCSSSPQATAAGLLYVPDGLDIKPAGWGGS